MEVIQLHHDSAMVGHAGYEKTMELISRSYCWPGMATMVKDYTSRCERCAHFKGSNQAPSGLLLPLEVSDVPWQHISADFITDLPVSKGYDSILTVVDRFSKEVEFIPCHKTCSALDTAKLYLSHVWKHHGLPLSIVSDRGPQFASQLMKDVCKCLGIMPKLSTANHPQTDGQTERLNHKVQQYLQLFCAENQQDWTDWLPLAQFSYNSKMQASTKFTPFSLTKSYVPRMGIELPHVKAPAAIDFASAMKQHLLQAKENILLSQERMKVQADKHRSEAPSYMAGDKVWLSTNNLRLTRPSKKLSERWLGPYEILSMKGSNAVELRLPKSMRIHPVVNISRVKPYKERLPGQPVDRPGPVLVTEDRDDEYEVDYLVDSRLKGRSMEYLVHWKGYPEEDRTWESAKNLANAKEVVASFHIQFPNAP